MDKTQNDMFAKALMPFLHEAAKTDFELARAMEKENKSERELVDYIVFTTTKGECKSIIVDGNEVMQLAIQYYKDDSIVMPKLAADKPKEEPKAAPSSPSPAKPTEKKQKPKKQSEAAAKTISMFDMFEDM